MPRRVGVDNSELDRLGAVLACLEECTSDWALSTYRKNGLLRKIELAQSEGNGCELLEAEGGLGRC